MVAINIMLIGAVLIATWFATQQSVQDHLDGEHALGVAATMLTFEQRVAASSRLSRQQASASLSSSGSSGSREDGDLTSVRATREIDAARGAGPLSPDDELNSGVGVLAALQRRGAHHFGPSV